MNVRRLLNSPVILTLLAPTLPTGDPAPTQALTEPLDTLRTSDSSASVVQTLAGFHTWDSDADFAAGDA